MIIIIIYTIILRDRVQIRVNSHIIIDTIQKIDQNLQSLNKEC